MSIPLWVPKEVEEVQVASIENELSVLKKSNNKRILNQFIESNWTKYQAEYLNWNRFKTTLLPKSEKVLGFTEKQYNAGEISYFGFINNYRLWKNIHLSELDQRLVLSILQSELTQTELLNYIK